MDAPRGLQGQGRQSFTRTIATLTANGEDAELYLDSVERYARAVDLVAAIRRAWVARGAPVLASGSRGQVVAHPVLAELRDAERHAHALSETLLLTPMARHKASRTIGRPRGASTAIDRQPGLRLRSVPGVPTP